MTALSSPAEVSSASPPPQSGRLRKWLPWVVLVVAAVLALAVGLQGHSSPPSIDSQVNHIASELKCPVCNGETVAESQSAPSVEIRNEIRQDLVKGESSQQIVAGFEASYGPGILEKPPASGVGLLVWLLPVIGVLLAGTGLVLALRRWRRVPGDDGPDEQATDGEPEPPGSSSGPESVSSSGPVESSVPVGSSVSESVEAGPVGSVAADEPVGVDPPRPARRRASTVVVSCIAAVIIAAGAAWALVGSTGHRLPGQTITGQALGADQINADLLAAQADEQRNPPDAADAVKQYQDVLNSAPNQVEALTGEGWLLAQTGQPALVQQGLGQLEKAESIDSTYGPAHLYRGLALLGEADYKNAATELQWYLDHGPDASLAPTVRQALAKAQAGAKTEAPPAG